MVTSASGGSAACRRGVDLLGAEALLAAAELEALEALLVPLRAHATGTADGSHVVSVSLGEEVFCVGGGESCRVRALHERTWCKQRHIAFVLTEDKTQKPFSVRCNPSRFSVLLFSFLPFLCIRTFTGAEDVACSVGSRHRSRHGT